MKELKEQDYMKIMGSIRGEYLEEAVSWNGAQRRRIRQIRRMTVSFGAVAAALAMVIGMIAYKASKDKIDTADQDKESSVNDDLEKQKNLYGGHGELRQISGEGGTICYDDDYVYEWDARWSVRSGGKVTYMNEDEKPQGLFMDGEHLFRLHDGKIFETDSFGKETVLIDIAEYKTDQEIDTNRITKIQKLSNRLVALFTDEPQDITAETVLIADLQKKRITLQPEVGGIKLFPDTESSYYVFGMQAQALLRYDMDTGSGDVVWLASAEYDNSGDRLEFKDAVMQDGTLYLTGRYYRYGEEDLNIVPERYWILDVNTLKKTEKVYSSNERIYAGTAFLRALFEDGKYCVYRSTLALENEKLVYSVPVDWYFDTEAYGMPKQPMYLPLYESEDMLILHLPRTTDDDIPHLAKHGEEGVLVDLKTGKVIYYGEHYDSGTPDDSSIAEAISTTVVSGTVLGNAENGTTVSGTTQNSTAAGGTTTTAAQNGNAARFTVADGSNIFGGEGYLYPQIGRFCMDGSGDLYEIGYSGERLRPYSAQSLMFINSGSICQKETCKHNDESCPLYHYNLNETRMNADGSPKDGVQVQLLDSAHVQRGTKVYTIDERTGAETLLFEISQVNGIRLGDGDLRIGALTKIGSADESAERYFVNISLSLDLAGVDPDSTYLMLVDAKRGTQKLIGRPGPEGIDENNISWGFMQQDYHDAVYAMQNQNTLVRVDARTGTMTSYPLDNGSDGAPLFNAWCVRDNKMWYADNFGRWLCFDLNTKKTTVIKENIPLEYGYAGNAHCVNIGDGMFVAIKKADDGYSRTLIFFRYDWKNSTEQYVSNITPLTDLEGAVSYMGNYMVLFQAQDGYGLFYQEIPDWDPTFSG